MAGEGPFLWLSTSGPPAGYWSLPPNGMCISAFLFVTQGDRLLLGKYADDPHWTTLTGLDPDRYRIHGKGWTIPATHLKFGEAPRAAAERVAREVLGLQDMEIREAGMESDQYTPTRFPHLGAHYDLWLFYEASLPEGAPIERPEWYSELSFQDTSVLSADAYGRGHEDVVARWRARRSLVAPDDK